MERCKRPHRISGENPKKAVFPMIHLGGLLSHQATFKSSEWGHLGPLPPYRFLFSKYWQIWSQTPSKQEITQVLV